MLDGTTFSPTNPQVIKARSYGFFKVLRLVLALVGLVVVFPVVFVFILIGVLCTSVKDLWFKGINWSKTELAKIFLAKTMASFFK